MRTRDLQSCRFPLLGVGMFRALPQNMKILTADQMTLQMFRTSERRSMMAAMRCTVGAELGLSPFSPTVRAEAARRVRVG